jgi:pimeloyl-ACP methyl ester carboxylesterase
MNHGALAAAEVIQRRVRAADLTPIAFTWWRRPSRELLVLAPGFWRVRLARENLFLANHYLRLGYDVVALDFRGHGDSGGSYSFGAHEALDLKAVIEPLVGAGEGDARPYRRFAILGLSLGGSIAADALRRFPELPCRALAMISSPADLRSLRPRPWMAGAIRQVSLKNALRMPRLSARSAVSAAGHRWAIADSLRTLTIPKLIITAEGDWLVDPSHGRILAEAAAPPIDYVHLDLPGNLHADSLVKYVPLRLLRVLDRWFAKNAPPTTPAVSVLGEGEGLGRGLP